MRRYKVVVGLWCHVSLILLQKGERVHPLINPLLMYPRMPPKKLTARRQCRRVMVAGAVSHPLSEAFACPFRSRGDPACNENIVSWEFSPDLFVYFVGWSIGSLHISCRSIGLCLFVRELVDFCRVADKLIKVSKSVDCWFASTRPLYLPTRFVYCAWRRTWSQLHAWPSHMSCGCVHVCSVCFACVRMCVYLLRACLCECTCVYGGCKNIVVCAIWKHLHEALDKYKTHTYLWMCEFVRTSWIMRLAPQNRAPRPWTSTRSFSDCLGLCGDTRWSRCIGRCWVKKCLHVKGMGALEVNGNHRAGNDGYNRDIDKQRPITRRKHWHSNQISFEAGDERHEKIQRWWVDQQNTVSLRDSKSPHGFGPSKSNCEIICRCGKCLCKGVNPLIHVHVDNDEETAGTVVKYF